MLLNLFILLFVVGLVLFLLSTEPHETDISNTYQVQTSFLSIIIWAVIMLSSFNIETSTGSEVDEVFFGVGLAMFIISVLNIIVIFMYGSFNALFRMQRREEL